MQNGKKALFTVNFSKFLVMNVSQSGLFLKNVNLNCTAGFSQKIIWPMIWHQISKWQWHLTQFYCFLLWLVRQKAKKVNLAVQKGIVQLQPSQKHRWQMTFSVTNAQYNNYWWFFKLSTTFKIIHTCWEMKIKTLKIIWFKPFLNEIKMNLGYFGFKNFKHKM